MNKQFQDQLSQIDNPFHKLDTLVKILRGPDGCPWDKKQTASSLLKYLREETDELIEAVETKNSECICEEIGDVYLILSLLANIYQEKGDFTAEDPLQSICTKMIRRHPHVFAGEKLCTEEELRSSWERIKQEEKREKKNILSLSRP